MNVKELYSGEYTIIETRLVEGTRSTNLYATWKRGLRGRKAVFGWPNAAVMDLIVRMPTACLLVCQEQSA